MCLLQKHGTRARWAHLAVPAGISEPAAMIWAPAVRVRGWEPGVSPPWLQPGPIRCPRPRRPCCTTRWQDGAHRRAQLGGLGGSPPPGGPDGNHGASQVQAPRVTSSSGTHASFRGNAPTVPFQSPQPKGEHRRPEQANVCRGLAFGPLSVTCVSVRHASHAAEQANRSNAFAGQFAERVKDPRAINRSCRSPAGQTEGLGLARPGHPAASAPELSPAPSPPAVKP